MKYTLVRVVNFTFSKTRSVHVVKEADSMEEALKYKLGAEMLESKDTNNTFEILINVDNAFDYINKTLPSPEKVKEASSRISR